jgi:hypothetical protein
MLGIAELSNPGVKYRLNQATEFLAVLAATNETPTWYA